MDVYFWSTFAKKDNSTATPSLDIAVKYEAVLKNPSSVITPVITVKHAVINYFYKYNYVYIPDFSRYYFVDDIVSDGMLWTYSLHSDVLASFKTQIAAAPLYVLRSSTQWNGEIADGYYPVTFERRSMITEYDTLWNTLTNNTGATDINVTKGCFVIGIVALPTGSGAGSYGSIKYYALSQTNLLQLVTQLLTNTVTSANGFNTADATLYLQKSLINPLSYIKSCIWLPVDLSLLPGTATTYLNVWEWTLSNVSCKLLTSNKPYYKTSHVGITTHSHPQAATRGAYLNAAPYTHVSLLYPPFGLFEIDTSELVDGSSLGVEVTIDYISGLGTLDIFAQVTGSNVMTGSASAYNMLQRIKSQVGVSIQLSEVGYDYSNMAMTLIGTGAEYIQAKYSQFLDSTISNAVSQIGTAVNAMRTKASTMGSNGGFSELAGKAKLYEEYFTVVDEDIAHVGRPLCKMLLLKNCNHGYYLIRSGDAAISGATYGEQSQIRSYLEGGFYYE